MRKAFVIILAILCMVIALNVGKASASSNHWRRIPPRIMVVAKIAANRMSTSTVHCSWTNWYHSHIRCNFYLPSGDSGTLMIHRVSGHRYLFTGTMYGIEIYRHYSIL
jgi:hypothetical protein